MASEPKLVVLISGCSSGIGLATAVHLAKDPEQRFKVYATMRNLKKKNKLEEVGGECLNKTLFIKQMDVSSDESVERAVKEIQETDKRIDVLFNNAGLGLFGILETIPIEKAQQMFDVVFFGAIRTIKAVLPAMKLRGAGLILQNSSLFGLVGVPFSELYCAAKFALEGFIESLAPTLLNFDIRCVLMEPGPVASSFGENLSAQSQDIDYAKADPKSMELMKMFERNVGKRVKNTQQTSEDIAKMVEEVILNKKTDQLRYPTNMKYGPDEMAAKFVNVEGVGLAELLKKNYFDE